jgi:hypothetical protein
MACPNFKNGPKTGLCPLGVKELEVNTTKKLCYTYVFQETTPFIGPYRLSRGPTSWCKNDISSRVFQTNITTFALLMLVNTFTLHMFLNPHIVFILFFILYIFPHITLFLLKVEVPCKNCTWYKIMTMAFWKDWRSPISS